MPDRILRVPLEHLPDEQWIMLRRLAYHCSQFGNAILNESFAKAKGVPLTTTTYTDWNEQLASSIRDAVQRECVGMWRRLGKKILRGEQTLGRFSANRALVIRGRGVKLLQAEDGTYQIRLRLVPEEQGEATFLSVWMPAVKRDKYLRSCLEAIVEGAYPLTKATVVFERPGRKIFVFLSYKKPLQVVAPGSQKAELVLESEEMPAFTPEGEARRVVEKLWLRANGHSLSLTNRYWWMSNIKANFSGLQKRLKFGLNKRGYRHQYRQVLAKAPSFEAWARGPLHNLSREIIDWCQKEQVGELVWRISGEEVERRFPWAKLREMTTYKGEAVGIVVSQPPKEPGQTGGLRKKRGKRGQKNQETQGDTSRLQGEEARDGE